MSAQRQNRSSSPFWGWVLLIVFGLFIVNGLSDGAVEDFLEEAFSSFAPDGASSAAGDSSLVSDAGEAVDAFLSGIGEGLVSVTPAPTPVPTADPLPGIPEELRGHVYLAQRSQGVSSSLTGKVVMTVFFVDDPESCWTQEDRDFFRERIEAEKDNILREAARYGAELDLSVRYEAVSTDEPFLRDLHRVWADAVLKSAGLEGVNEASDLLEARYDAKEAPILFYRSTSGRSFAVPFQKGTSEYTVMFRETGDKMAVQHELYHLFGAKDIYYPAEVKTLAEAAFPNSIMLTTQEAVTDELTAYLIGWTEAPGETALQFLRDTAHLTDEYLQSRHEEETYTGYVENRRLSNGVFTGTLVEGFKEGWGRMEYDNGDVYEGNFAHNSYDGEGSYTWQDGMNYTGSYVNGKRHGYGVLRYPSGSVYEGEFRDSHFHGQGTFTWSNGTVYTGEWYEDEMHGLGTMTYENGAVRTGEWNMGEFAG